MGDSIEKQAIVVIGGAAGIGGAILEELARTAAGAKFWITYNSDRVAAERLAARIPGATAVRCDMRERASLQRLADSVAASGATRLRALVHAGVEARRGTLYDVGADAVSDVVRSSAVSLLEAAQAFDSLLGDGSSVVYLTSIGARRAIPEYGAVGVAKAAGEALVRYLSVELAPRGVRVNALSAGALRTKAFEAMFAVPDQVLGHIAQRSPRGRGLEFEEVAFVASSLCDPRCSGISGQVITVDGGYYAMR